MCVYVPILNLLRDYQKNTKIIIIINKKNTQPEFERQ